MKAPLVLILVILLAVKAHATECEQGSMPTTSGCTECPVGKASSALGGVEAASSTIRLRGVDDKNAVVDPFGTVFGRFEYARNGVWGTVHKYWLRNMREDAVICAHLARELSAGGAAITVTRSELFRVGEANDPDGDVTPAAPADRVQYKPGCTCPVKYGPGDSWALAWAGGSCFELSDFFSIPCDGEESFDETARYHPLVFHCS